MTKAVAYYRVSTAKQGESGLGLEAQRVAVEALCAARGWEIVAPPFTEVESGKRDDRPELAKALDRCRLTGAVLVVAKLDRLSRDAAFILALRNSQVKFVCADQPDVNDMTIGILAVVAEAERKAISTRTREALAAAKARGMATGEWVKGDRNRTPWKVQRLGNPNGAAALRRHGGGQALGAAAVKALADERAEGLRATVADIQAAGITSMGGIAKALNERGILTSRKAAWHASSVRNLLARLA